MSFIYNDELAIRKLHDEVIASLNKRDLEKLLSLHSDDIVLMEPNMETIHGKEEVKKLFDKFQHEKISFKLDYGIDEVEVFGPRAFVRGRVMRTIIQMTMNLFTTQDGLLRYQKGRRMAHG